MTPLNERRSRSLSAASLDSAGASGASAKLLIPASSASFATAPSPPSRAPRLLALLRYYLAIPWIQVRQTLHNGWGILNVWDLILLRPMAGGLLSSEHPFATGKCKETGGSIWHANVLYASPRADCAFPDSAFPDSDRDILTGVGEYLAGMVRKAAGTAEHPRGRRNHMPPAIYLIHGAVHYNGGWLLFNDFGDAISHFTDPRFVADFRRFVRETRREPLLVFRSRTVDSARYQEFIGFIRTVFPYFANSNGKTARPLWGNSSPFPVVNVVTGSWIRDTRMLLSEAGREAAPRPPIPEKQYFQAGPYMGERREARRPERWLASFHALRIVARRERGNVYFVDQRRKGLRFDPLPPPTFAARLRERSRLASDAHERRAEGAAATRGSRRED